MSLTSRLWAPGVQISSDSLGTTPRVGAPAGPAVVGHKRHERLFEVVEP